MVVVSPGDEANIIAQVRELVRGEKNLKCSTSGEFLIRFIKASNYNVMTSFKLIKDYYRAKIELPNEFVYNLPSSYENFLSRIDLAFPLPREDALGRTLLILRLDNVDPRREDWFRCCQALILVLEWLSLKPDVQEYGISVLVDCTSLTYRIMKWASPHKLKTIVKILQECVPVRFEVIHIINAPTVFNMFFAALKQFLHGNFHEKFKWHKPPYADLYNYTNSENLPKWLGGTLDLEAIKYWYKDLLKEEDILKEYSLMGYQK